MTPKQRKTAELLADGILSRLEVAAQAKIAVQTLYNWLKQPAFANYVAQLRNEALEEAKTIFIAQKAQRLRVLARQATKLTTLITRRAEEMGDSGEIAGGETGMLTRKETKYGTEYRFDAALNRELRETLKYAAVEMGEWSEGQGPGGGNNLIDPLAFIEAMAAMKDHEQSRTSEQPASDAQ